MSLTIYRTHMPDGQALYYPDGLPELRQRHLEVLAGQLAASGHDITNVALIDADTLQPFVPIRPAPLPPYQHEIERARQRAEARGEDFDEYKFTGQRRRRMDPLDEIAARRLEAAPKPAAPEPPATHLTMGPRSFSEVENDARARTAAGIRIGMPIIERLAAAGELEPWELEIVQAQVAHDVVENMPHDVYRLMRESGSFDHLEEQRRKIPDRFRNNPDAYGPARDATMRKVNALAVAHGWLDGNLSSDVARDHLEKHTRVTGIDEADPDRFMVDAAPDILSPVTGEERMVKFEPPIVPEEPMVVSDAEAAAWYADREPSAMRPTDRREWNNMSSRQKDAANRPRREQEQERASTPAPSVAPPEVVVLSPPGGPSLSEILENK